MATFDDGSNDVWGKISDAGNPSEFSSQVTWRSHVECGQLLARRVTTHNQRNELGVKVAMLAGRIEAQLMFLSATLKRSGDWYRHSQRRAVPVRLGIDQLEKSLLAEAGYDAIVLDYEPEIEGEQHWPDGGDPSSLNPCSQFLLTRAKARDLCGRDGRRVRN